VPSCLFYHFYSCLRIEDYTIIVVYLVLGTIFFIILIRFVIAIIIYIFSSSFLTFLMFFQWSLWSAWAGDASCDQCDARRAGSYRTSVFVSSIDLLFGLKCFPLSFTDNLKMFFLAWSNGVWSSTGHRGIPSMWQEWRVGSKLSIGTCRRWRLNGIS